MKKNFVCLSFIFFLYIYLFSYNIIRAERDFSVAVDIYKSGDLETAIYQFDNYIAKYPTSSDSVYALFYKAEALYKLKKYEEAIKQYEFILNNFPKFKDTSFLLSGLAYSYYGLNDLNNSKIYYQKIIDFYKDKKLSKQDLIIFQDAYVRLIEINYFQKEYSLTINLINEFKNKFPDYQKINYIKLFEGKTYYYSKNYDKAIIILQDLLTDNEYAKEALFFLAQSYDKTNKKSEAKNYYLKFLENYKDYENIDLIKYNLGWIYLNEEQYEKSIEYFSNIKSDAGFIFNDAKFRIAQIYFLQKKYNEAIDILNVISDYDKNEINYLFALIYYEQAKYDDANNYLEKIFAQKDIGTIPEKTIILKYKVLYKLKRYNDLIIFYELTNKQLKSDENLELINYLTAKSAYLAKDFNKAEIFYVNFLNNFKETKVYLEIKNELANIYYELGKYNEALKIYDELKKEESLPIDEIIYFSGSSYFKLNKFNEAKKEFLHLLNNYPSSKFIKDAIILLCDISLNNKEYQKVIEYSSNIISKFSDYKILGKYYSGLANYYLKNYNQAIKDLTEIINSKFEITDIYKAYLIRGICFFNLKNYEEAKKDFNEIINNSNNLLLTTEALFYSGIIQYKEKKYNLAIASLTKIKKENLAKEYLPDFNYFLALSYYYNNDFEKSYLLTKDFKKNFPKTNYNEEIEYINGINLFNLQKYDEAYDNLLLIRKKPQHSYYKNSLYYLTKIAIELNKLNEAEEYNNILLLDKKFRYNEVLFDSARIKFLRNQYNDALSILLAKLNDIKDLSLKNKYYYLIAFSYLATHNYIKSSEYFLELLKTEKDEFTLNEVYFNLGISYFKNNNYKKCIEIYEQFLNKFPDTRYKYDVIFWLGKSYFNIGKYNESINELLKIIKEENKNLPDAIYTIASANFNLENYDTAIKYYNMFIIKFPDSDFVPDAKFGIGLCYKRLNDVPNFIKIFEEIVKLYPERSIAPSALFEIGKYFYENKNYKEAVVYYKTLIDSYPKFDLINNVIYELGTSQFALEEYDKAKITFEEFVKHQPDKVMEEKSLYFLGNIYFLKQDYAKALEYFSKAKIPAFVDEINYKSGICYFSLNNFDSAIYFLSSINREKLNVNSYYHSLFLIGSAYNKLNNEQKKIEYFEKLIKENVIAEYMPFVIKETVNYYVNNKLYNRALEPLNFYINNFKDADDINDMIFYAAKTAFIAEDFSLAENYFKRLINIKQYYEQSLKYLSEIYLKKSDTKNYINIMEKLLEAKLYNLSNLHELANAYLKENRINNYIEINQKIIAEFADRKEALPAYLNLANHYNKLKDYDKAIDYYSQYLDKLEEGKIEYGDVQLKIGLILFEQKNYKDAIVELWKIKVYKPEKFERYKTYIEQSYYYIIKSYLYLNEKEKAKNIFDSLVKEFPDSKYINELKAEF